MRRLFFFKLRNVAEETGFREGAFVLGGRSDVVWYLGLIKIIPQSIYKIYLHRCIFDLYSIRSLFYFLDTSSL